jgi:hypothetical protein
MFFISTLIDTVVVGIIIDSGSLVHYGIYVDRSGYQDVRRAMTIIQEKEVEDSGRMCNNQLQRWKLCLTRCCSSISSLFFLNLSSFLSVKVHVVGCFLYRIGHRLGSRSSASELRECFSHHCAWSKVVQLAVVCVGRDSAPQHQFGTDSWYCYVVMMACNGWEVDENSRA